tara:strand:- start:975 stop:1901 length:927 start_codon:yes stop_codon:yes gene_type:complete
MGFNPFKSLKKIVKKVGRGIKKIGRGLKKIMTKIAKPFAKLGPLGTIALGMLMPWAAGAIWTGMTGTSLTLANFGAQAATNIASDSLFKKAIGYVMKGIHWGATKVKTAYQFVSDKISSGIDTLTNKAKEVFGMDADAGDLIKDAVENAPEIEVTVDPTTMSPEQITQQAKDSAKELFDKIDKETQVGKVSEEVIKQKTTEKGFFGQAVDKAKESVLGSIGTNIEEALSPQEANMGSGMMYPSYDFLGDNQSFTKYNQNDLILQNKGFTFGGPAYDANITTSSYGQDEYYNWFNTYKSNMQNFLAGSN